jgi:hypothetical protein
MIRDSHLSPALAEYEDQELQHLSMKQHFIAPSRKEGHSIWIIAGLILTCILLSSGCGGEDPAVTSQVGRICTWEVPEGLTYTFQDAPGGISPVSFKARVYHATLDTNCTIFDSMPHPLVIYGHGRYPLGVPTNYLGMTNLMNHLASWGDICVSVNLDVVNGIQDPLLGYGIPHRGELLLHAVEYMARECRTPGSVFYRRIDTTKIALVGHSRGGGAVIYAANYNSTHRNRPIRTIATISPANFGTDPLQVPIPHLSLYGSWDGDLYRGEGPDIWSRGPRNSQREFVEIYGANHYYFTDVALFPENQEISRDQHHTLSKGFINAWLDWHLRGNSRYNWAGYLFGSQKFDPTVEDYISYHDNQFLLIDDGNPLATPLVNNLGGANSPIDVVNFIDFPLALPPDYNVGPALQVDWNPGGQDRVEFRFPAVNCSAYSHLSFRVSQVHGSNLNRPDTKKDFNVTVKDVGGRSATVRISNYLGGLQYPDLSGSLPEGDVYNRKQLMRSFRIPKTDFAGVDFTRITSVQFTFNRPNGPGFRNNEGAAKIDDVEFTN